MNHDTRRTFLLRLAGLTAIAIAARYTLVLPRVQRVEDLAQRLKAQAQEVEQGERAISLYASEVDESVQKMSAVRDDLADRLAVRESTQIHKRLQHGAENNRLTVSRIEPLKTSTSKAKASPGGADITLETLEFRVECVGPYAGIVGYLDDLASGPSMTKVTMFRMVPTSSDSARIILQVAIHQLVQTPDAFTAPIVKGVAQTINRPNGRVSERADTRGTNTGGSEDEA